MEEPTHSKPSRLNLAQLRDGRAGRIGTTIGAAGFTLAVGYADYATGLEVRVFPLYFVPVGLVAWSMGRNAGLLFAVGSISTWEVANRIAGLRYSNLAVDVWNVFVQFAALVAFSILLSRLRTMTDRERASARVDSLTGLFNSRMFYERARNELERARRFARPLTVAYIDLDNFKAVNDQHGHHAGDELLRLVGRTLAVSCRQTDVAARMGGDEFALLIPESDAGAATTVLERVRKQLADALAEHGTSVTASIGAVCFERAPTSVEELVEPADALMYRVKQSGKNGLVVEQAPRCGEP
jgi:diguanylate cyclase (GGDEF)-like protein